MKKKYAILIAGSACMLGAANTWANVTIDLSEAAYPPLVKKFAAGGFFEKNDTAATTAIAQTGDIHLPMYRANIREPRLNYTTKTGTNKGIWLGNDPATGSDLGLLYKTSSGVVHPNFDLNLDNLRATVATDSMLNYIRWDGVPFLVTTNAISAGVGSANDDDLFDAPSSYGPVDSSDSWDWSPPPHSGNARINFASKMGEFIALMVDSEKINGDGFRPTIWAFWQEPDHCLGDPSTPYAHHSDGLTSAEKFDNIRMFVKDLYQPLSSQVKAADPDLMVSGVAQNSNCSIGQSFDGTQQYSCTTEEWVKQEVAQSDIFALDYFSMQLYKCDQAEQYSIPLCRYALKNKIKDLNDAQSADPYDESRFDRTPAIISEYNYKPSGWTNTTDEEKYHLDNGKLREVMENWSYLIDQPDIAYVVLQGLPSQNPEWRCTKWLQAYMDMPEQRVKVTPTAGSSFKGFSGYDPDIGLFAMIWNTEESSKTEEINLLGLSGAGFDPEKTFFFRLDKKAASPYDGYWNLLWSSTADDDSLKIEQTGTTKWNVTLAANKILFIASNNKATGYNRPGDYGPANGLATAHYGSHTVLVPRQTATYTDGFGHVVPKRPTGTGHYDQLNSSLIVGVENGTGIGVASVVLRDVPNTYQLKLNVSSVGITGTAGTFIIRWDYLDGETILKSCVRKQSGYANSKDFGDVAWFPSSNSSTLGAADFLSGSTENLLIGSKKPTGWATANGGRRRVRLSVMLADIPGPATATVTLHE